MVTPFGSSCATDIDCDDAGTSHVCSKIGFGSLANCTTSHATRLSIAASSVARRKFGGPLIRALWKGRVRLGGKERRPGGRQTRRQKCTHCKCSGWNSTSQRLG